MSQSLIFHSHHGLCPWGALLPSQSQSILRTRLRMMDIIHICTHHSHSGWAAKYLNSILKKRWGARSLYVLLLTNFTPRILHITQAILLEISPNLPSHHHLQRSLPTHGLLTPMDTLLLNGLRTPGMPINSLRPLFHPKYTTLLKNPMTPSKRPTQLRQNP